MANRPRHYDLLIMPKVERKPRRKIDRVAGRPKPSDWGDDDHLTLYDAIRIFWPEGPLTVASLRTEIGKGRLQAEKIAGKIMVTPAYLRAMRARAREEIAAGVQGRTNRQVSLAQTDLVQAHRYSKAQLEALAYCSEQRAKSVVTSAAQARHLTRAIKIKN